jgi:hypothetical protein
MAKKFMFVCVGILALTVAFLLGAQFGRAEYVDHAAYGIVAGSAGESDDGSGEYGCATVLLDNGEVWSLDGSGWQRSSPPAALPVPISQIKFWTRTGIITTSNEVWWLDYEGVWRNAGSPPIGPTATQPATWGSIKAQFKD